MNTADHDTAMKLAEFGDDAAGGGDEVTARGWYRLAYRLERKVADALAESIDMEPTRSIIHRSAASLAMQIGRFDECEELIGRGLSGNPPAEIVDELRDLQRRVKGIGRASFPEAGKPAPTGPDQSASSISRGRPPIGSGISPSENQEAR